MSHRVYLITNTINDKRYVGKTKLSTFERWQGHQYCARHESPYLIHAAIRKYGVSAFIVETLIDDLTTEDASMHEIRLIAEFGTLNRLKGYNMTPGGDGVPWTPEIGAKMSASRSGERNPMFGRTGTANPMFGKKLSESSRAKISVSVRATRAVKPLIVSDETRQHMVQSSTRRFAHIVPLHTRVIELRNSGLKYIEIVRFISDEFGLVRSRQHYAALCSDHRLSRCKTCLKINFTESAVVGGVVTV